MLNSVLTLGSLYLPCYMRDTAWSWLDFVFVFSRSRKIFKLLSFSDLFSSLSNLSTCQISKSTFEVQQFHLFVVCQSLSNGRVLLMMLLRTFIKTNYKWQRNIKQKNNHKKKTKALKYQFALSNRNRYQICCKSIN